MYDFFYSLWLIIAISLVIAELFLGTVYLLVIAVSAFLAWLCQLLGLSFLGQAIIFTLFSVASVFFVYYRWQKQKKINANDICMDLGETVVIEKWVNGIGQTTYRGANWSAILVEEDQASMNDAHLYVIIGFDGNRLKVKVKK